jgi:hypothetical protein
LLLNWRWWPAVTLMALVGLLLPEHLFASLPQGSVAHQVWAVVLKLVGSYVLVVACWVLLLAWVAVLLGRGAGRAQKGGDDALVPVLVGPEPLGEDAVRLPLPESGDDAGGKA